MHRLTLITAALLAFATPAAAATAADARPAAHPVPGDIAVTDGSKPYLVAHAAGEQVYTCAGTAWQLLAPRAVLADDHGKTIGTHYAGPTWEALDGSTVKARRDTGVTVDPSAIQWLRLAVATTSAGPDGDRLTHTTWIHRINTVGGLAPANSACTVGTTGEIREVPYTADYVFWK